MSSRGATGALETGQTNEASRAAFRERLRNYLDQPRFASSAWGIKVVSLEAGETIFERNSAKLLKPASNAKLFTAALALDKLGPDYRIRTSLYARARPDEKGILKGDLVVYGRGDPCFAARFHSGKANFLQPLVESMVRSGVKQIEGDLIGDESYFVGPRLGSGWTWDDLQYYYGAEVSALSIEDNVVDLVFRPGPLAGDPCQVITFPATAFLTFSNATITTTNGRRGNIEVQRPLGQNTVYLTGKLSTTTAGVTNAVSVFDPARFFMHQFAEALKQRGIHWRGQVRVISSDTVNAQNDYSGWVELGFSESQPLSRITEKMMKPSQNLYAQLLLLQVGAGRAVLNEQKRQGSFAATRSTEEAGIAELRSFVRAIGITPDEVRLDEGSGLSRAALVTPNAIVSLLQFMDHHPQEATFKSFLPIPGGEGTLRTRLPALAGKLKAKTGSFRYVSALSGYLTSSENERLAFSIMLNNFPGESSSARDAVDGLAVILAEAPKDSEEALRKVPNEKARREIVPGIR